MEYGIKLIVMIFSVQMYFLIMIFMVFRKLANQFFKNYQFNSKVKEKLIETLLLKVHLLKIIHKILGLIF